MIRSHFAGRGTMLDKLMLVIVTTTTAVGACALLYNGHRFEGWVGVTSLIVFLIIQLILPRAAGMSNPAGMRIMISLLMLISLTIGRYFALYKRFEHYDKLQHLLYGIVVSIVAVVVLYRLLPESSRRRPEFHGAAIGIFSTGLTMIILFIWELFEYICDRLFASDMQDWQAGGISGLTDTVLDLAVGFSGAVITSTIIVLLYGRDREGFYLRFLAGFFPHEAQSASTKYKGGEEAIPE